MNPDQARGVDYYAENYRDYARQNSDRKLEFYMKLLGRWVPPGSRIFELGSGLGLFLQKAATRYDCTASELNPYGAETSRSRVPNVVVYDGSFDCISAEPPPQAVVAWDVLEHISDLDRALDTIYSRLSSGGFLIGVVPVYDSLLGPITSLLDKDPTHVWKLSRHEWLDRFGQRGFTLPGRSSFFVAAVAQSTSL
jgi:cyclopropane fatty-acyl-phospholipid synthase-like methyltransferase